ncbi:protein regulator of cytokinesis 1-like [Condylostylus longicornis]|uniref:protein regulator of cytokinesis 1-like n=1 Tax=Condylostylus longicornis TaxID=2530218 RepID=UPI00244DD71E|nr:protein regulator of cytokinesis 1-like [Condylostylus longicornis]
MESFNEAEARVIEEVQQLSLDTTATLRRLWMETFDLTTCEMNIKKLPEHVKLFYDEIIQETKDRQEIIRNSIKDLHDEASNLRRLLKVDVTLSPQKNVPLYIVQIRLDERLQELRNQLKKRKDQIVELLLEQEILCEELCENPRPLLDDPLPTEDELADFRLHLDTLKGEKNNRIYLMASYRKDIKSFMEELEMPIRTDEEEYLINDRSLALSQYNINRLKDLREQYINQMEETRESIDSIKKKLEKIWDCINASPKRRAKFSKYTGYSQTTYDFLYKELNRCEAIKRQNIKFFVDKCRQEIVEWWEKTMKSDAERSRFTHFTNDWYTEDLLALHEIELEELKRFYEDNEQIFNLIRERSILWNRMEALEDKALEPGRYNNRGGQLLKEEKERKTISNKLPKIEEQLKELVVQYEMKNGRKFTVFGDDILEIIRLKWEEKKTKKEKQMSARKNAATPTQSRNMSVRTALSVPSGMTRTLSAAKLAVGTFNSSSKRKLPFNEKLLPSSKRNLVSELEASKTPFKAPLKRLKPVIGTTIRRKSARLSNNKKRRSKNKLMKEDLPPKIKVNDVTTYSSSEATSYDCFEEYILPTSRSSIMHSNESTISMRRKRGNIENTTINRKNASAILKLVATPSKSNVTGQISLINKKEIRRNRALSPVSTSSSKKLTTKNLPIII